MSPVDRVSSLLSMLQNKHVCCFFVNALVGIRFINVHWNLGVALSQLEFLYQASEEQNEVIHAMQLNCNSQEGRKSPNRPAILPNTKRQHLS